MMIAKILIAANLGSRIARISQIISENGLKKEHPDVLYFEDGVKLGVLEIKKIREYLSLKPYNAPGRAIIIESAQILTRDAQNALLKTLEEPPAKAIILLGADSENNFLATVLSRCEIIYLDSEENESKGLAIIKELFDKSIDERLQFIEKLEDKEIFLKSLAVYFKNQLASREGLRFSKKIIEAEKWQKSNVNLRAILEYLMLELPER